MVCCCLWSLFRHVDRFRVHMRACQLLLELITNLHSSSSSSHLLNTPFNFPSFYFFVFCVISQSCPNPAVMFGFRTVIASGDPACPPTSATLPRNPPVLAKMALSRSSPQFLRRNPLNPNTRRKSRHSSPGRYGLS